ncbi:tetratricopeptide repeat protein [Marinagarivorans algicola]|uniref:tetratricopeptide repeat protein n=1 Tax=Marinagarivorans algicola TaxID=1513270 RepID=UPI0012E2F65D|nr:hypothetical protein [Marinagarivorans algicola]
MKYIGLLMFAMLAACTASEDEKQNLKASAPMLPSKDAQLECDGDKAPCPKLSSRSLDELEAINDEYFYTKPKARVFQAPSADADMQDNQNGKQVGVYRRMAGKLYEIAVINSMSESDVQDCWLTVDGIGQYKGKPLLKTICHYSGTGHFFKEQVYLIEGNALTPIAYDSAKIQLPHKLSGETREQLTVNKESITYTSTAIARYCDNCKKSFSVQLDIKKTASGDLAFVYLKDSYKPFFTTESNVENKKGLALYRAKDYAAAAKRFSSATQLDVANYEAFANLGLAYLKDNQFDASIAASMQAYQGAPAPQKANAAYNIGLAYEKKSDVESALKYYTDANRIKTTDARQKAVERMRGIVKGKG